MPYWIFYCSRLFPKYTNKNDDISVGHFYATVISKGSSDTRYIATCDGKMIIDL